MNNSMVLAVDSQNLYGFLIKHLTNQKYCDIKYYIFSGRLLNVNTQMCALILLTL